MYCLLNTIVHFTTLCLKMWPLCYFSNDNSNRTIIEIIQKVGNIILKNAKSKKLSINVKNTVSRFNFQVAAIELLIRFNFCKCM